MTSHRDNPQQDTEQGATAEAVALHGDRARAERYEQPDAVELPAGTRIATGDDADAQ